MTTPSYPGQGPLDPQEPTPPGQPIPPGQPGAPGQPVPPPVEEPAPRREAPVEDPARRDHDLAVDAEPHRTRTGSTVVGMIVAAILLILVIVFVAQNSDSTPLQFFGWDGDVSLAVALLAAFVAGMLLIAIPGSLRLMQLRRQMGKIRKAVR